jgi:hypothetical protein
MFSIILQVLEYIIQKMPRVLNHSKISLNFHTFVLETFSVNDFWAYLIIKIIEFLWSWLNFYFIFNSNLFFMQKV